MYLLKHKEKRAKTHHPFIMSADLDSEMIDIDELLDKWERELSSNVQHGEEPCAKQGDASENVSCNDASHDEQKALGTLETLETPETPKPQEADGVPPEHFLAEDVPPEGEPCEHFRTEHEMNALKAELVLMIIVFVCNRRVHNTEFGEHLIRVVVLLLTTMKDAEHAVSIIVGDLSLRNESWRDAAVFFVTTIMGQFKASCVARLDALANYNRHQREFSDLQWHLTCKLASVNADAAADAAAADAAAAAADAAAADADADATTVATAGTAAEARAEVHAMARASARITERNLVSGAREIIRETLVADSYCFSDARRQFVVACSKADDDFARASSRAMRDLRSALSSVRV